MLSELYLSTALPGTSSSSREKGLSAAVRKGGMDNSSEVRRQILQLCKLYHEGGDVSVSTRIHKTGADASTGSDNIESPESRGYREISHKGNYPHKILPIEADCRAARTNPSCAPAFGFTDNHVAVSALLSIAHSSSTESGRRAFIENLIADTHGCLRISLKRSAA